MSKITLVMSLFLFLSCYSPKSNNLIITNNSDNNIVCFLSENNKISGGFTEININEFKGIMPRTFLGSWTRFLEKCDNKQARLYIIAKDSVDKYGLDVIYKKGIYNKKYLFTIEDLEKINWEIEYKGESKK